MRPQRQGRRPRAAASIIVSAAALIVGAFVACGGDSADTVTPTPTPPAEVSPPRGTPTPTPLPSLEPTAYRFLYSEFGMENDIIWSIAPTDPAERVKVATVPHKSGWSIKPALSPDGKKIAYNAMPGQAVFADTDAEARILDLESGETTVVAEGVDLRTVPRWSPDGGLLFLRRNVGEEVTVILVDLREPEDEEGDVGDEEEAPPVRTVLRQHESDVLSYIPVGFDGEEATLFFVQVQGGTESGSFLGRFAPATGEAVATATAIVEATATASAGTPTPTPTPPPTPPALTGDVFLLLSDQIARDYALSPDASRLAFLVPGLVEGQFVARTYVADISGKQVSPLASPEALSAGDQLNPLWHPDGGKISVGQLPGGLNPGRVAVVPLDGDEPTFLAPPEQGFDQPLSWSPDAKFLAVRSFPGDSLGNPGTARLVFVSTSGQRRPAPEGPEIEVVGWVKEG